MASLHRNYRPVSCNFALSFKGDFLLLDVSTSTARLVYSSGGIRYLDERTCRRVLRTRRNDVQNPLHIIAGHWTRDLLRLPPIAAELPEEFEQSFLIGKPWFFGEHEFLTEQCILS